MELGILFLIGLGTGLSGAVVPGPLFLFTVSQALKKNTAVGLRIACGHIIIEAVFVIFIFFGFKDHLTSSSFLRIVSGLGGAALIGMGIVLMKGAARMTLTVKEKVDFSYGDVTGGAFFSVISPGFLIWWATIGFAVVVKSLMLGLAGLAMAALGHWLADIAWHWFVAYFIHKGKYYIKDGAYRMIVRFLAFGLFITGVLFLTNGPV